MPIEASCFKVVFFQYPHDPSLVAAYLMIKESAMYVASIASSTHPISIWLEKHQRRLEAITCTAINA